MANHKSAIKRARQNIKRRERNQTLRTSAHSASRLAVRAITGAPSREEALKALVQAESTLQKISTKGAIPKTRASRKVSRLADLVSKRFP